MKKSNEIIEEFKKFKEIETIALAGSSASKYSDELSDWDIYIYSVSEISPPKRREIAEKFSSEFEINNQFFETGDEWITEDGIIDIMYRSIQWIEEQIKRVYVDCSASVGYSTCFIYNVKNSEILYDPHNRYKKIQNSIYKYPDKLVKNIIAKNLPLLKDKATSSYYEQVEKAIKRNDLISVNHRTSAFLASYFDILFAVNKLWHPGEKRLLRFAKDNCEILPEDFEKNINLLLTSNINEKLEYLEKLNIGIKKVIDFAQTTDL